MIITTTITTLQECERHITLLHHHRLDDVELGGDHHHDHWHDFGDNRIKDNKKVKKDNNKITKDKRKVIKDDKKVTALATGCSLVLYDGSPLHPHTAVMWDLVDRLLSF